MLNYPIETFLDEIMKTKSVYSLIEFYEKKNK